MPADMDEIVTYLKKQPTIIEEAKETVLLDHVIHAWYLTGERIDYHSPERMISRQTNPALRWAVGLLEQSDDANQVEKSHEWMQVYEEHLNQGSYVNEVK